jgi:hypothetical protein
VLLNTAVGSSADLAEAIITYLRYEWEREGETITSVQSSGFGDGRAFKSQFNDGKRASISYLFRVHQLIAEVTYISAAGASDAQSQAVAFARQQEAKLFAAFAPPPPPPTPTPTAVPTPVPTPGAGSVAVTGLTVTMPVVVASPAAPYCRAGEQPQFRFGFATLSTQLGARMGRPTSCEYDDPRGSGDTLQNADNGLAVYRRSTETATFTTGAEHWAISGTGIVYWTGDSIDPPESAEPFVG